MRSISMVRKVRDGAAGGEEYATNPRASTYYIKPQKSREAM